MNKKSILLDKTLIIFIILLFVSISFNQSTAIYNVKKSSITISNGNILYVGGSGEGNYSKIQDAIDNATNGDIIFAHDDTSPYNESLNINKSNTFYGENMTTTIIHGCSGINSDYVVFNNFTFWSGYPGLSIKGFSNNVIENCVFNKSSITLGKSNDNIIRNCSFYNCEFGSLLISNSNNNEICYCDFFDGDNWWSGGTAISIFGSRGIKLHHCVISRNFAGGLSAEFSVVQINYNNIFNNDGPGVSSGFLASCDLRNNWWGSSLGPNITLQGRFGRQFNVKIVDNGDLVFFWGRLLVVEFFRLFYLIPWLTEPVYDAGHQI